MKADKTFSGVTPDYGTIMRVNTHVTSETTAALMEQLSIYDSAYLGGHLRPVRRALFIDRPMFGLSMMENNIPLLDISLTQARQAFKPYDALNEFDALLEQMGGSTHAPAVTVIPVTTLLANGYKFADTLIQSQNAWYQDNATWLVGGASQRNNRRAVSQISINNSDWMSAMPVNAPYVAWRTVGTVGHPTTMVPEQQPYADGTVILLPILGQGPAPFLVATKDIQTARPNTTTPNYIENQRYGAYHNLVPLRWAVFYQEQDVEVDSPIRKLVMIAFLNHLFDYLDGVNLEPGQYQWPDANGNPSAPYTSTGARDTGHDLINEILAETVRAAAIRLEYMTAEELPTSNEMQLIRAVANVLYFLDNRDVLIQALCNTSSIRQFITILLESQLVHAGAQVMAVRHHNLGGVEQIGTDFQAGVAPPQACQFLWSRVLTMLPEDVFVTSAVSAVGGPIIFKRQTGYDQLINYLTRYSAQVDDTLDYALRASSVGRTLIKNMATDMRADYVASAVLNRLRESVPVIISLLKGEIPGFEHLHIARPNAALSMEVTLNILETIQLMLERDLLATKDVLEWEEPYSGAHFATAWQAYSVKFPTYPIEYIVHNLAVDYLRELRLIDEMPVGEGVDAITAVTRAFQQVGLTLIQCEPTMTYLPLGTAANTVKGVYRTYMKGEMRAAGRLNPYDPSNELSGDVSVAHAALRVTSTYYVRSATIWNQMMEMPRQVVARAYNPQPTPVMWHDFIRMDVTAEQLAQVLSDASPRLAHTLLTAGTGYHGFTHLIDINPAFRDVACLLPYVQMMVQTPPEAYDFTMYSRVVFEADQKICNIAGTPVVLEDVVPLPGCEPWALPNLTTQMAYHASPVTHMILPLSWNAVR